MQEVTVPFWIQRYHILPSHHPSSWKVRRAFGVCLREKICSLKYKMCKWCVICTMCKQSTPQQWGLHQAIKACQMQVAKCNYHTTFPTGKKEQPEMWEFSAVVLHLNGTFERTEWRLTHAALPRQEQKCPQQILFVAQVNSLLEHKDWKKEAIIVLMFSQHGG